ncbi:MAG: polymerase sigma-70 factor, subfamily [Cryptosporangiaceae bacterium]|nr:polymerase sigma-70 factor, subfamily [Cryptosporangiaceae bacterium]
MSADATGAAIAAGARLTLRHGLAELARAAWDAQPSPRRWLGRGSGPGPRSRLFGHGSPVPLDAAESRARPSGPDSSARPTPRPSPRSAPRPAPIPGHRTPRPSPHPTRDDDETAQLPIPELPTPAAPGQHPAPGQPAPGQHRAPEPPQQADPGGQENPPPAGSGDPEPGSVWAVVKRAQEGDTEAFGEIYDRYIDMVFRYIYFRVGTRQLAEDLTSETYLRALRRIGSVTWQGRDLGAWLVTIARNLIADHYKSGRYRLEVTTADMLDTDRADTTADGRPEAAVLERLTNATLLEAVKKLNPEQQECIVLRFLQGLSVTETATVMGKNEGAIKALQYRAVRSLGRLLPEGFTP